jgi:hypothetical protein
MIYRQVSRVSATGLRRFIAAHSWQSDGLVIVSAIRDRS